MKLFPMQVPLVDFKQNEINYVLSITVLSITYKSLFHAFVSITNGHTIPSVWAFDFIHQM